MHFFPYDYGNSFEHDFVEDESGADQKEPSTEHSEIVSVNPEHRRIVWNAKVNYESPLVFPLTSYI